MLAENKDIILDSDKSFVETRNKIQDKQIAYGDIGLFLGLFMLIFVAFRDTFKILKKK